MTPTCRRVQIQSQARKPTAVTKPPTSAGRKRTRVLGTNMSTTTKSATVSSSVVPCRSTAPPHPAIQPVPTQPSRWRATKLATGSVVAASARKGTMITMVR